MARAEFLAGACVVLLLVGLAQGIGVNWGTMASHRLSPSTVVQMLKDNGITKAKLFDADPKTVGALAGSGIEVMLGIPNNLLGKMADDYENAQDWVDESVSQNSDVKITYVAVGNEPFLSSYNGSNLDTTLPALKNIQKALNEAGHSNIKATVPHNADVYESGSNKPSDGNFRGDIKSIMLQMIEFQNQQKSPFLVNIYPFLSLQGNAHFPFEFAFCDNYGQPIDDKGTQYKNVFDANYDTLVWSLKKNGYPDMKIIVGEVGWPTDGDKNANAKLAQRFYDGFLKKMAKNEGTPMRPGRIEYYMFGLLDEDQKSILPGMFERHWGIFRYDGQPKFPMDFTGKGQYKMPVGAKGVQYQTQQWCVVDPSKAKDRQAVAQDLDYACTKADCSSLGYSCQLNDNDRISYALNMYYQTMDQDIEACGFEGMGQVVTRNASVGDCLFPIMIVNHGVRLGAGLSIISRLVGGLLFLTASFQLL